MAITLPIVGQEISAANFGIPVANKLNGMAMECIVGAPAIQNVPNATSGYAVQFATEVSDPYGMHDPAQNTKINLAVGLWLVQYTVVFVGNATGSRVAWLRFAANPVDRRAIQFEWPTAAWDTTLNGSHLIRITATSFAEVLVAQDSGVALGLKGNDSASGFSHFAAIRLGD